MVKEITVTINVVDVLTDDDLLIISSEGLSIFSSCHLLMRLDLWRLQSSKMANILRGSSLELNIQSINPLCKLLDMIIQRLTNFLINKVNNFTNSLIDLSINKIHMSINTWRYRLYLIIGSCYLTNIQTTNLLILLNISIYFF